MVSSNRDGLTIKKCALLLCHNVLTQCFKENTILILYGKKTTETSLCASFLNPMKRKSVTC